MTFRERAIWIICAGLVWAYVIHLGAKPASNQPRAASSGHYQLMMRDDGMILFDSSTPAMWIFAPAATNQWKRIRLPFEVDPASYVLP